MASDIPTPPAGATPASAPRPIHWAFQPLRLSPPPPVQNAAWTRTTVDRFILAALEGRGLHPSTPASKRALLRRVTLDLIGLPPEPEETARFLADTSPEAYARVIERLLASFHFGERWGRHWLDWSGYVDVLGGDNDAGTIKVGQGKWRYRDYVIRSFFLDKPFDQFIREQ